MADTSEEAGVIVPTTAASVTATTTTLSSPTKIREKIEAPEGAKKEVSIDDTSKPKVVKNVVAQITLEDADKIAKRKARFGVPEKEVVEEKKSKRAMRFGGNTDTPPVAKGKPTGKGIIASTPEIEEKKKARAERFGKVSAEVEEKKKAREARFSTETK